MAPTPDGPLTAYGVTSPNRLVLPLAVTIGVAFGAVLYGFSVLITSDAAGGVFPASVLSTAFGRSVLVSGAAAIPGGAGSTALASGPASPARSSSRRRPGASEPSAGGPPPPGSEHWSPGMVALTVATGMSALLFWLGAGHRRRASLRSAPRGEGVRSR